MFLSELRVENFRAIRRGAINFDDGTVLIGENDCGISSMLDALELVLGFDDPQKVYPPWFFHRNQVTGESGGPIRIRLRFTERSENEWKAEESGPLGPLLRSRSKRPREIWYEAEIREPGEGADKARYRLRSPVCKTELNESGIIGRFRRMNPVVRVAAGMLTGHGFTGEPMRGGGLPELKVSADIRELIERINRAVESRITRKSMNPGKALEEGFNAAISLVMLHKASLGKWESGLTRSVKEILGWQPGRDHLASLESFRDPESKPERLGILLLIAALLRAAPGGMAPDADPLWIIEEPEAHLHPITLTSVAEMIRLVQRQKVITTYSGDLLSAVPLGQVRRMVRHNGELHQRRVHRNTLSRSEMRRFQYHLRSHFGISTFARLWLLVEGESEYWFLPQLARLMGYDLALEGIACIEFAQCGLDAPLKVARDLGIEWHLLADGDAAGQLYADVARHYIGENDEDERLTVLAEKEIERSFWAHGYEDVYKKHARLKDDRLNQLSTGKILKAAVRKRSKPFLALSIIEAIASPGSRGIPPQLSGMIETCIDLARRAPSRIASP